MFEAAAVTCKMATRTSLRLDSMVAAVCGGMKWLHWTASLKGADPIRCTQFLIIIQIHKLIITIILRVSIVMMMMMITIPFLVLKFEGTNGNPTYNFNYNKCNMMALLF